MPDFFQEAPKFSVPAAKEADFYHWLVDQAEKLRRHDRTLDWENLAEELQDMGNRERRELGSHLEVLLKHLLKWQFRPGRRGQSWRRSIKYARRSIADLLEDSPSLKGKVSEVLPKAYARARSDAVEEMRLSRADLNLLPQTCPWDFDQLLKDDFWPDGLGTRAE